MVPYSHCRNKHVHSLQRYFHAAAEPLLKPWMDALQAKEDLQRATRYHNGEIRLVADNAAAHKSYYTQRVLSILDISRIA